MEKITLFQAKRIALKGGMDIVDKGRTLWPQQHGSILDATAVTHLQEKLSPFAQWQMTIFLSKNRRDE